MTETGVCHIVNEQIFSSNTFVIPLDATNILLVDPVYVGPDGQLGQLINAGTNTKHYHVFLTHEHIDHFYGINELLPQIKHTLYLTDPLYECAASAKKNLSFFFQMDYQLGTWPYQNFKYHSGTWHLELWGVTIYHTPGHSVNSCCLVHGIYLFGGDTVIDHQMVVTKLPGGSRQAYKASLLLLKEKLYGRGVTVLPGHGNKFELDNWFDELE
jgi:glyoxylase-like metal-dependent hydrolase (beta-lactamase superfamily II)